MTSSPKNLSIDADRLWQSLEEMAKIGPGVAGGNNRQALTDVDAQGRALFHEWCVQAGCEMGLDQMGNMFARREGLDPSAAPVFVGSHLDTQPTGGRYDGVLGVLAGLEIIRTMNDLNLKTRHPIVITNWTNEEGTRFAPAMLASGVFAGVYDQDWAYERRDIEGAKFGDEINRIGWRGDEVVGSRDIHAFFELHIEQGPVLEAEGKDIGVVTGGQGVSWTKITLTGKASHTGTTPMPLRRNAGLGLARIVEAVEQIALSHAPNAVGAVGRMNISPNSTNVVPGEAEMVVDFRSPDKSVLHQMDRSLREFSSSVAGQMGLGVTFESMGGYDPVSFDPDCVDAVRTSAEALGYSHLDIVSGAGHDACFIARIAPTAMVFCPCVDGLSHNEAEEITQSWAKAGGDVLFHAVLSKAGLET